MVGKCVKWAVSECVYAVPESTQQLKQVRAGGGGIGWHMTVGLEVYCPKSLLKYDASGNLDSDTGATSIVNLSIPDDITLHSNREEVR